MGFTVLEVLLGAAVSIGITIAVEILRQPKLELAIATPLDMAYDNRPANDVRFLVVDLTNRPISRLFRWLSREPALHCDGTVDFYHLDKQKVFPIQCDFVGVVRLNQYP